jgi:hypothetical protein
MSSWRCPWQFTWLDYDEEYLEEGYDEEYPNYDHLLVGIACRVKAWA